jgi:hypothetical protein
MAELIWVTGDKLSPPAREQAKARFVHRFTREHKPTWARGKRPDGKSYRVQFASDADWLEHSEFAVTKSGKLDARSSHCVSHPTWPDGEGFDE